MFMTGIFYSNTTDILYSPNENETFHSIHKEVLCLFICSCLKTIQTLESINKRFIINVYYVTVGRFYNWPCRRLEE